ncbi:hypothetical protein B0H11DRAFT_2196453 [Mycena galericulata]|nr:hypothetical protein B0H11DRAFT_2196453 [Mycena galericulata]
MSPSSPSTVLHILTLSFSLLWVTVVLAARPPTTHNITYPPQLSDASCARRSKTDEVSPRFGVTLVPHIRISIPIQTPISDAKTRRGQLPPPLPFVDNEPFAVGVVQVRSATRPRSSLIPTSNFQLPIQKPGMPGVIGGQRNSWQQ